MNWLTQYLTREGPGVPRNPPRKRGLALLTGVVAREWWTLIELNLLLALFCLPIVTIPAAQVAAIRVCGLMIEDRNVYLLRDFCEIFRRRFWRSTAFGIIALAAIGVSLGAAFVSVQAARDELFFALPLAMSVGAAVFLTIATTYGFALLAAAELPIIATIRLSVLGALARPLPVLGAMLFVGVLWLLHVALYPASIFMPALINFGFGTLAVTFGVHDATARLLAYHFGAPGGEAYAGGSVQPHAPKGRKLS